MALSLSSLFRALTPVEVETWVYGALKTLKVSTETWEDGDPTKAVVTIVSQKISDLTQVLALAIGGGFLDYAVGVWLTLLAKNVYNVDRIEATFAKGFITLTNGGGGEYADIAAGDLTFFCPANGKTYRNTNATPETLASGSTLVLPIEANEVGKDSSATIGQISTLVTTLLGVTCSNAAAVVGSDEEKDEPLRNRCRLKLGALSSMGLRAGYEYWALSTRRPDGTPIIVTRVKVRFVGGVVRVLVAKDDGGISGDDVTLINAEIQARATPFGVTSETASATERVINVTNEVWIYEDAGLTEDDGEVAVQAKLAAYIQTVPIGGHVLPSLPGRVYTSALLGEVKSISPGVIRAAVTVPAEPGTDIAEEEVAVVGTVTTTVHLVAA